MTEREANELVGRRLVFGNEDQIRAVRFLGQLAEARKAAAKCSSAPHRRGIVGYADSAYVAQCRCVRDYSDEVLAQLALDQKTGRIQ